MQVRLNRDLFQSIVYRDVNFFDVTATGEITSRLTSDTTKVTDVITLNINVFLRSSVQAAGVIVQWFRHHLWPALTHRSAFTDQVPTRAVRCALLRVDAHGVPIGACNPVQCPILFPFPFARSSWRRSTGS